MVVEEEEMAVPVAEEAASEEEVASEGEWQREAEQERAEEPRQGNLEDDEQQPGGGVYKPIPATKQTKSGCGK